MEKLIVGDNYSINEDAVVENKSGEQVPAKDVLCQFLPAALMALDAAKALTKNFIVKWAFSIVINALEALGEAFCNTEHQD